MDELRLGVECDEQSQERRRSRSNSSLSKKMIDYVELKSSSLNRMERLESHDFGLRHYV